MNTKVGVNDKTNNATLALALTVLWALGLMAILEADSLAMQFLIIAALLPASMSIEPIIKISFSALGTFPDKVTTINPRTRNVRKGQQNKNLLVPCYIEMTATTTSAKRKIGKLAA